MTSYIQDLADILHIEEYGSHSILMMQFIRRELSAPHHAFFDETEKDDVIGVAGWLGSLENWISFEDRWRKTLPPIAEGDFHYKDFWGDPTYWSAKLNFSERVDFVKKLAVLSHNATACAVGTIIYKSVYDELVPPEDKKALISPLHFCVAQCLVGLVEAYKSLPNLPPPPLRVMFDQKKGYEGKIADVFYNVKALFDPDGILGHLSFGDRKQEPPLQAADLLIGEMRRKQTGEKTEIFELLHRNRALLIAFPSKENFRDYIKAVLANRTA